jgi:hypothetical protein
LSLAVHRSRRTPQAAVLQPKDADSDVGRRVLEIRHPRNLAVLVAEDLDGVVAVADGALVERAFDAAVSFGLASL